MELWDYERQAWNSGAETVCGVDEAGAGPLMGPVYAAAVILPRELDIPGLNDSKKLAEKKREALYEVITTQAVSWSVTRVEAWEIDEMDILNARMLAMQRAIEGLSVRPDTAFIDGNRDHGSRYAIEMPHQLIVGGDGKSASIAAASILAKVSRDRYVSGELDAKYPQYQFAKHKGRYEAALCDAGPVRSLPGAPAQLFEKVGGQTPWVRPRAPETGARRRWPAICGRRAIRCWKVSGAAGLENWI